MDADENRILVVNRDIFFDMINEQDQLKVLEKASRNTNINGPLNPLLIVPKKDGTEKAFYYLLFDQFERYMSQKILGFKDLTISEDDQFALMLLMEEKLSRWLPRS
jgi:hypothetical protein